jgi:hypothetical protein
MMCMQVQPENFKGISFRPSQGAGRIVSYVCGPSYRNDLQLDGRARGRNDLVGLVASNEIEELRYSVPPVAG